MPDHIGIIMITVTIFALVYGLINMMLFEPKEVVDSAFRSNMSVEDKLKASNYQIKVLKIVIDSLYDEIHKLKEQLKDNE
jgi:hypothetical protein